MSYSRFNPPYNSNYPIYNSFFSNRTVPIHFNDYPEYPQYSFPHIPFNRPTYSRIPDSRFIDNTLEMNVANLRVPEVPIINNIEPVQEIDHGNFFKEPRKETKTDNEIFINAMKEQIILLRDLEKMKEKLAITENFHINYVFIKFDDNNSGSVSLQEFKEAVNNHFKVQATEKECYLIIRQHSSNDRLTVNEFEDLLLPKSGFMQKKLRDTEDDKDFVLKPETVSLCSEIFDIHLKLEKTWEKLKKKLQYRKTNLKNLFKFIDSDQNEYIESSDIKIILEKNFMVPAIQEFEFVFHRFDHDKNKKIQFMEFLKELTTTPSPPVIPKLKEFIDVIKKQMEVEKKIEQKKAELIKLKEFDFDRVYKIFDENGSGSISFTEFKMTITETLEVKKCTVDDLSLLFQTYNTNDDGKLTKNEFKKMIYPSDMQLFQKIIFQPGGIGKKNEGNYKFLLVTIIELLLEGEREWRNAKKIFKNKEETLKLLFKQMDYDKDDLLKESDFRAFLQDTAGFVAQSSEIFALIRRFDQNGDCNIDLDEFLAELSKGEKKKVQEDFSDELISLFKDIKNHFNKIEKARAAILKRYDFHINEIREIFDSDHTGSISIHEIKKGFNVFGVDIQDKICYLICNRFSESQNFFLNYDEFEDLFNLHANIHKKLELPAKSYKQNLRDKFISNETSLHINNLFSLLMNFEIFFDGKKNGFKDKKIDVSQIFKSLDDNKDKLLDKADLEKFCKKNELVLEKNEISFLMFLFGCKRSDQVSLEIFTKAISPIEKFDEVAKKVSIIEDLSVILREVIKVCREIETFKQAINNHEFNVKELFLTLDSNGGGVLTKDELLEGLKRLNIDISDAECRILMREYCMDDDLEIMSFKSFRQMFIPLNSFTPKSDMSIKSRIFSDSLNREDIKHINNFIQNLVRSELKVEKLRQKIVEKKIDLLKIFKLLDVEKDGFLSGDDFIKFIIKSDIASNNNDVNLIVSRFDKDKSNTISREEFISELLPTSSTYGDKGNLAEFLKGIFTEQLIRLKVLEDRKIQLITKKNFRIYELFNLIDETQSGVITNIEFRSKLFEYFEIKASWEDINLLIFKYSSKKDELLLNLEDFKKMFIPATIDYKHNEAFSRPSGRYKSNLDDRLQTPIGKFFRYLVNYEIYMKILRRELKKIDVRSLFSLINVKKSPYITWEAFKDFIKKHEISDSEEDAHLLFSVYDVNQNGKISEKEFVAEYTENDFSNLFQRKQQNFDHLKIIFVEMKRILSEMERWKENLCERKDFRFLNLYKMFDLDDSNLLSKKEILRFFRKHGIMTNEKLISLLMKKYSLDKEELIDYEEFCLMLLPSKRQKTFDRLTDPNKYGYNFDEETWKILKKTFQILSEGEAEMELLRRNIEKSGLHLEAIFRLIDTADKGKISRETFADYLKTKKILTYPDDIKCIIKRLDKKSKGQITLQDFVDELKPTKT